MTQRDFRGLAREALDFSKSEILVPLRFMSPAFSRLSYLPQEGATLATDGVHIRYDPLTIVRTFSHEQAAVARDLLHMVLHNVFLHTYPGEDVNELYWDTACDIVVERTITELALPATKATREATQAAISKAADLPEKAMTAEQLYRWLLNSKLDEEEIEALHAPFLVDDHSPWHVFARAQAQDAGREGTIQEGNEEASSSATKAADSGTKLDVPENAKQQKKEHSASQGMDDEDITQKESPENMHQAMGNRFSNTIDLDRSKEQWKNAAYEMGVQLDAYAKMWGVSGDNLTMGLAEVTRKKQDYREFLHKFAVQGEHIRINPDEFDYIYYTYGLRLYENLPLIEPLEYVEERRIRDFVIAIDTSSSTKDGLVRKFIERTYSILAEETSFFSDMNVLIIQCDAAITDVATIHSREDFDDYLENLEIKGLGGTDFRPVFTYVNELVEAGKLPNLAGLIYFTDGQGTYPKHMPSYRTAFVFVNDSIEKAQVPTWAIKIQLEETMLVQKED